MEDTPMLQRIDPTRTQSWQRLLDHFCRMKPIALKTLFAHNPERFHRFSIRCGDLLLIVVFLEHLMENIIEPLAKVR